MSISIVQMKPVINDGSTDIYSLNITLDNPPQVGNTLVCIDLSFEATTIGGEGGTTGWTLIGQDNGSDTSANGRYGFISIMAMKVVEAVDSNVNSWVHSTDARSNIISPFYCNVYRHIQMVWEISGLGNAPRIIYENADATKIGSVYTDSFSPIPVPAIALSFQCGGWTDNIPNWTTTNLTLDAHDDDGTGQSTWGFGNCFGARWNAIAAHKSLGSGSSFNQTTSFSGTNAISSGNVILAYGNVGPATPQPIPGYPVSMYNLQSVNVSWSADTSFNQFKTTLTGGQLQPSITKVMKSIVAQTTLGKLTKPGVNLQNNFVLEGGEGSVS